MRAGESRAGEAAWREAKARPRVCPACLGRGVFGDEYELPSYPSACPCCEGMGRVSASAFERAQLDQCDRKADQAWVEAQRAEYLSRSKRRSTGGWLVPVACVTTVLVFAAGVIGALMRLGLMPW